MTHDDASADREAETTGILLRDGNGEYYLLTPALLAEARIDATSGATLADQVGTADVHGFLLPAVSLLGIVELHGAGAAEIISPRDAASGLPTGKRMHKPF
jgi:hypothetical protein